MEISETVTSVVSLLGGPHFNAEDIDWAADLPAGRKLLEWLVAQLDLPADDGGFEDASLVRRATLTAISLEEDELEKLRRATESSKPPTGLNKTDEAQSTAGYTSPWRLKKNTQALKRLLLEAETEVVKTRLQQSKVYLAPIKSIAQEIERTDNDILAAQERLSELSLKSDESISSSLKSSLALLDSLRDSPSNAESHSDLISAASSLRSSLIQQFQLQMHSINATADRLPGHSTVQSEASRLHAALNTNLVGKQNRAVDAALEQELARLCEEVADSNALAALLANQPTQSTLQPVVDVKTELEGAWALDQAAILDARGAVLDETIATFSDALLPPLTSLHDALSTTDSRMREAEALLAALQEEIEDIVGDVQAAQNGQNHTIAPASAVKDVELQTALVDLLKRLHDLRPVDAAPLVLLSQEDILSELQDVYDRGEAAKRREAAWTTGLLPALREIESSYDPLLAATYANSPMNTSPPFAFTADVCAVQANAKTKAEELGSAITALQEDVQSLESDRVKRRLQHFVEKWAV
ncbi:hypothetical protein C8J57DRAFT_1282548 [Mycena rebaudengoi]|nr:hypothetical protein C8J57DRAFT_1282548 [Mycena rebaudengoi]